jgi:hypothetical protein
MPNEINHDRRRLLAAAAMTVAAVQLGIVGCANAQSAEAIRLPSEGGFPSLGGATGWLNSRQRVLAGPLFYRCKGAYSTSSIWRGRLLGEGDYQQSEAVIQQLLSEAGSSGFDSKPVSVDPCGAEVPADLGSLRTSETYVGAASFNNPDHVDIVIHDYRWRLGLAERRTEI